VSFATVATSSSNTVTSGTSAVTTFPTGVTAGDLLLLVIATGAAPGTTTGWTGWTKLVNTTLGGKAEIAYRRYQAGDTAPTIGGPSTGWAWLMLRITGGSATAAPEVGTFSTSASGQPDPPSYTASYGSAATLWIAIASATGNAIPSAAPANYTGLVQSSAAVGPTVGIGTRQLTTATEDPGAFAGFSGTWYAATIAVPPGAFPTVASNSNSTTTAASVTTTFPAGVTQGDLLLLIAAAGTSAGQTTGWTGWTQLNNNGGTANKLESGYRYYQTGDTAPTLTAATTVSWAWLMLRITAASASTAPQIGTFATSGTGSGDPPSYTPGYGQLDTLWIAAESYAGSTAATVPTSYAGLVNPINGLGLSVAIATRQLNAASENPGAFGGGSGTWFAVTFAVPPVSGGVPIRLRIVSQAVARAANF